MAEDNMEISYDDHEDDDIDIDIEIDQQNQDEDYMEEDVKSQADVNDDDVMADEDNTSFAMEDDDYMPDHTVEDIQTEAVEITEVDMTPTDTAASPHSFFGTAPQDHTQDSARNAAAGVNGTAQQVDSAASTTEETHMPQQPLLSLIPQQSAVLVAHEAPASPEKPTEADEHVQHDRSPSSSPKPAQQEHEDDPSKDLSPQAPPQRDLISEERSIMVQYNDTEYALVSSSESDDPDSYFLKDTNVLKEPLSIFFAVIRDILSDEIGPHDELCLSIDDLGLDTFETCLSNNDVTFSQLVDLHTTLLRNDGETDTPPLYITLSTKAEFGRSFEKMIEDAKSGHGLYEIVQNWAGDDATDVWAGSEGGADDETSGGDEDNYEEQEAYGDDGETEGKQSLKEEVVEPTEAHRDSVEMAAREEDVHEQAGEQAGEQDSGKDQQAVISVEQDLVAQAAEEGAHDVNGTEGEHTNTRTDDDAGDEGDLLDYEDDDYVKPHPLSRKGSNATEDDVASPCLRPASCFCSSCNKRLLAEYEEINEKLDRSRRSSRSSSKTLEGSNDVASAQSAPEEGVTAILTADTTEEKTTEAATASDTGNHAAHGEDNVPEQQHEEANEESYDATGTATQNEPDDAQYANEDYTNYEEETVAKPSVDEQNDVEEEINEAAAPAEQSSHAVAVKDEDEISYEDEDDETVPHNESAVAENAAKSADVGISIQPKEDADEIDYDDDDDHVEAPTEESVPVAAVAQFTTGKRPHDEPDALDLASQDAKRARA